MENHPIQSLMKTAMESIQSMVEVNTIVGDPVEAPDGNVIIPISQVSFGFAAGGSEFSDNQKGKTEEQDYPFGGGSGGGVSIKPIAFLVVGGNQVRMMALDGHPLWDRLIDIAPELFDNLKNMTNQKQSQTNTGEDESSP